MKLRKFYQILSSVFATIRLQIFAPILLLGVTSGTVAAEPMKIVYFQDYPPFSWSQNNQMQGILIDVLDEALKNRMDIELSHKGLL